MSLQHIDVWACRSAQSGMPSDPPRGFTKGVALAETEDRTRDLRIMRPTLYRRSSPRSGTW